MSASELRHRFHSLLQVQGLPRSKWQQPLPVKAVAEPSSGLISKLINMLGMGQVARLLQLVQMINAHCSDPRWHSLCGIDSSALGVLHLRALHMWLLHVRLRSPAPDGSEVAQDMMRPSVRRRLFETFWASCSPLFHSNRELADMVPSVNKGWNQLDAALATLLHARADAEEKAVSSQAAAAAESGTAASADASEETDVAVDASAGLASLPSAVFGLCGASVQNLPAAAATPTASSPSNSQPQDVALAAFRAAPDSELLLALWQHVFQADRQLNPHHLARCQQYVLLSLSHLAATPLASILQQGAFAFPAPPCVSCPATSSEDEDAAAGLWGSEPSAASQQEEQQPVPELTEAEAATLGSYYEGLWASKWGARPG